MHCLVFDRFSSSSPLLPLSSSSRSSQKESAIECIRRDSGINDADIVEMASTEHCCRCNKIGC